MSAGAGEERAGRRGGNPCGVRVAFICIYVLCQLISCCSNKTKSASVDKPLLDKTCCYLSDWLPATRHVLAGGVQVHFTATTTTTKRADASFMRARRSHMHTICILISLEWFRQHTHTHARYTRNSQPGLSPPPPSTPACILFLSTCQSVFIIIAAISVASICQPVSQSILLSRFAKPLLCRSPSLPAAAPLLSCSQLLLQHLCCAWRKRERETTRARERV